MKSAFEIWSVGSFSDGSGRSYWYSVPTHEDAVAVLDGRRGVMGRDCVWDDSKMNYNDYWIVEEKISKTKHEQLVKDWEIFKGIRNKLSEEEIAVLVKFVG